MRVLRDSRIVPYIWSDDDYYFVKTERRTSDDLQKDLGGKTI